MAKEKKPKKDPKPPRVPLFKIGDVLTTKYTANVPRKFGRQRWLYLLPGTEWTVTGVVQIGKSMMPHYTLQCSQYTITRSEWRVRKHVNRNKL